MLKLAGDAQASEASGLEVPPEEEILEQPTNVPNPRTKAKPSKKRIFHYLRSLWGKMQSLSRKALNIWSLYWIRSIYGCNGILYELCAQISSVYNSGFSYWNSDLRSVNSQFSIRAKSNEKKVKPKVWIKQLIKRVGFLHNLKCFLKCDYLLNKIWVCWE